MPDGLVPNKTEPVPSLLASGYRWQMEHVVSVVIHKSKHIEKHADGISEDDVVFRRPANDITFQMEINFGNLARPSRGGRGGRGGRGRGVTPTQRSPEKSVDVVSLS
ncbi:hypothetical protein MHYP_G00208480 [Metynnis hypsauchen]